MMLNCSANVVFQKMIIVVCVLCLNKVLFNKVKTTSIIENSKKNHFLKMF